MNIAYQVFGDGPVDLVFVPGFISHIELAWEEPYLARFLRRLAAFARVIFFDKRGTGLSDPVARPPGLVERMDDIRAVMDAASSQTAALFGVSDGGCLCIAFTVAHPERSAALITYGSFARRLRSADYPWGWSAEHLAEVLRGMDQGWASGRWWAAANPSVAGDERYQAWWARYLRAAASPSMGRGALGLNAELDIRHLLAKVDVPALVVHRTNEQWVDVGNSRYLAAHIAGAAVPAVAAGARQRLQGRAHRRGRRRSVRRLRHLQGRQGAAVLRGVADVSAARDAHRAPLSIPAEPAAAAAGGVARVL